MHLMRPISFCKLFQLFSFKSYRVFLRFIRSMASEDKFEFVEEVGTSELEFIAAQIHNNSTLLAKSQFSKSKREEKSGDYGAFTKICQSIWQSIGGNISQENEQHENPIESKNI